MTSFGPATEAKALASAARAQCTVLRDFMQTSARPLLDRFAQPTEGDVTIKGAFLRVLAWMHSLSRLDDDGDFQAVTSGSRALFEIAVDLALLVHDPKHQVEMLVVWEQSAKLKQAERVRRYYAGRELPDDHTPALDFASREGARIVALRERLWPQFKGKHPDRWTGKSLELDAERADHWGDFEFRKFYNDRFAQLCWSTHGSGLAGVRLVPASVFPALAAIPFSECVRFGFIGCQLAIDYFPALKDDPITYERFRTLAKEGARTAREIIRTSRRQRQAQP
jgi:hypothetical protein